MPESARGIPNKWAFRFDELNKLSIDRIILLLPTIICVVVLCGWAIVSFVAYSNETGRNRAEIGVDTHIKGAMRSFEDGGAIGLTTFLDQISNTNKAQSSGLDGGNQTYVILYRRNGTVVFSSQGIVLAQNAPSGVWLSPPTVSLQTPKDAASHSMTVIGKKVDIDEAFQAFIGQAYPQSRAAMGRFMGFWLAAAVFSTLLIGAIFGWSQRKYTARISLLTQTLLRVTNGEHGIRVPVAPSGFGSWELDRLSVRINSTLDRIESTTGAIRDWTAQAAHELRGHLALVAEKIEALNAPHSNHTSTNSDVQQSALASIHDTLSLFDALLDLVAIRADVDRRVGLVDISQIFDTAKELYGLTAEEGSVSMVFTNSGPKLLGEQWLIMRATLNLVENALRFAPPKSTIDVSWEYDPDGAVMRVRDRGVGPLGATLQQMMKRTKVDRDDTGHRIGLRTVGAIAIRHGAKVEINDAQPGLSVRIFFPSERLIQD
jgi:signal transduction histidine kinase